MPKNSVKSNGERFLAIDQLSGGGCSSAFRIGEEERIKPWQLTVLPVRRQVPQSCAWTIGIAQRGGVPVVEGIVRG